MPTFKLSLASAQTGRLPSTASLISLAVKPQLTVKEDGKYLPRNNIAGVNLIFQWIAALNADINNGWSSSYKFGFYEDIPTKQTQDFN